MTENDPPRPPFPGRLRRHLGEITRLAWPVVLARSGILSMSLADTIMVGRFSTAELAYQGIGLAPVGTILVSSLGLLLGTLVMTAHALGAGRPTDCGAIWRRSLPYALALGLAGAALCAGSEWFLRHTGQSADLAAGGGRVMAVIGLGLPATLIFIATSYFLEGIRRPLPGLVIMVIANVVNLWLNWMLIFGHLGFTAMGAEGSAWATTVVRFTMALAVVAYVWHMSDRDRFAVRRRPSGGWRAWVQQRRIGYAAGASGMVESAAFATLALISGVLGALAVGSFAIAMNLIAIVFMTSLGMGSATAVQVGEAMGRGDAGDAVLAGWTGLGITTACMAAFAAVFALLPGTLAGAYTTDPDLLAVTTSLIAFSAFILVVDGGQNVMASALRGRGDTWVPTFLHVISYFLVMVPVAFFLTFSLEHGPMGLVEAILAASIVSVSLLAARFQLLTKRPRA